MELNKPLLKESPRIPRKPERSYMSSLKSSTMPKRRKPLQTYGKRASDSTAEPVSKRRCVNSSPAIVDKHDDIPAASSELENDATRSSPIPSAPLPPMKKGTITAYFHKIKHQPPVTTSSPEPPSDPVGPITTPPSSPPTIPARRRIRRLKTRVATRLIEETETKDDDEEEKPEEKEPTAKRRASDAEPSDCAPSLLTSPSTTDQPENTEGEKRRKSGRRKKDTTSTQTTLSLSTNEPQYTECKECDMLYNHLHKPDVKFHARRHAAVQRAKAKASAKGDAV